MTEFKVGERVSVELDAGKFRGLVIKEMPYGNLQLSMDDGPIVFPIVHPRQCRRLVKRKAREWTMWLSPAGDLIKSIPFATNSPAPATYTQITVREVRSKP